MQKIPTIFVRDEKNPKRVTRDVDPEVLDDEDIATEKFDGSACAIIDGALYKRHHHKADKGAPPIGWIHWSNDPEQKSGHGWLPCIPGDPSSRYHLEAFSGDLEDGTYELVGPKSNGNPHRLEDHQLWRHGSNVYDLDGLRTYDDLLWWFSHSEPLEGLVFHHPDGRMAKIKRRDFGLAWPA